MAKSTKGCRNNTPSVVTILPLCTGARPYAQDGSDSSMFCLCPLPDLDIKDERHDMASPVCSQFDTNTGSKMGEKRIFREVILDPFAWTLWDVSNKCFEPILSPY